MPHVLELDTTLSPDELTGFLRQHEPWGHQIDFSNGVSTAQLARRTPFSENPLQKLNIVSQHIPFESLRGGSMLDIGCNSGYNSIHAARVFGMHPVGIDVSRRHMQVAGFLAELAGLKVEFLIADAETFSRPGAFDVVLHFGTLYHLPNPLLSLRTSYANLKPGGYLAIETQTYDNPVDANLCYFVHMFNNDKTNFWALSTHVLTVYLELLGFVDVNVLLKVQPNGFARHMHRVILVARKPA